MGASGVLPGPGVAADLALSDRDQRLLGLPREAARPYTGPHRVARYRRDGHRSAVSPALARQLLLGVVQECADAQAPAFHAAAHSNLGFIAEVSSDLPEAERHHRAAAELASHATVAEIVTGASTASALEGLACVAARQGNSGAALRLLDEAARWRHGHRWPGNTIENQDIQRALGLARV